MAGAAKNSVHILKQIYCVFVITVFLSPLQKILLQKKAGIFGVCPSLCEVWPSQHLPSWSRHHRPTTYYTQRRRHADSMMFAFMPDHFVRSFYAINKKVGTHTAASFFLLSSELPVGCWMFVGCFWSQVRRRRAPQNMVTHGIVCLLYHWLWLLYTKQM